MDEPEPDSDGQEPGREMADDYAELFDEELIGELTGDQRPVIAREPVLRRITDSLDDPACRIVLLVGGAGSGKTGVLAALARQHRLWPRYFIRRAAEPETAYQHEGGLASFLTVVGLQLRARQPSLFAAPATLDEDVQLGVVEHGADLKLFDIGRVVINPFTELNIRLRAKATRVSDSNLTVVRIGEIVDAAYAAPQALETPALLGPARELTARIPGARIVILLDGVDELRLRDTSADVLNWLVDHTGIPRNVRFVIASRPDSERLGQLLSGNQGPHVKQVNLDDFSADAENLAQDIAGDEIVQQVLDRLDVHPAAFAAYAAKRSGGNFRYLALLRAMIRDAADDPGADLTWLAEREDRWPEGLNALYRDYLLRTRDRVGRAARDEGAWDRVYLPVLGMLAVAGTGLTVPQIETYGGITAVGGETCATALDRLRQLLRAERGSYRFDHASTGDFLVDNRAADTLWVDPAHWHGRITDYAFASHGVDGNWAAADPYLLTYLPAHAEAVGRLDDLIEDPRFLMAPGLDLGDRGILSMLGAVGRAKPIAQLIRQVLPMLRDRDAGTLPHLHLYARQAGLAAFADRVAALITDPPWSLLYTHWQRELVRGAVGRHMGAVNAIAVTRDDEGILQAFTAGDDGVFKIWNLTSGTHLSAVGTSLEKADPRRVTAVAGGLSDAGTPVVVSGDSNGTLRAWDLAKGVAIGRPLESFGNCGRAIAAGTVTGVPLVLCRAGARLRVWNLRDRKPLGEPMPAGAVSVFDTLAGAIIETPGGGALVAVRLDPEVSSFEDAVQVWNPSTDETRGFTVRATESATAIALAKPATDPGYAIVIGDIGGGVQAFDLDTGEQRWYHRVYDRPVTALAGGELDGRQVIVSGDEEGKIRVWELATGQLISGPHQVPDLDGGITAAVIVPSWDGGRLALAGNKRVPREDAYLDKLRDLVAKSADDSLAALLESSSRSVSTTSERRIVITARPRSGPGQPEEANRRRKDGKGKKNRKNQEAQSEAAEPRLTVQLVIRPDSVLRPDNNVHSMAVANSADHRVLVATDGYRAGVWNLDTGALEDGPFCGTAKQADAVAFVRVRDEQRAVAAIGGALHAWNIQTGQEVPGPLLLADHRISGLAVTNLDGIPVAVCTTFRDGTHVIDLDRMQPTAHWRDVDYLTSVAAGELDGRPVVVLGSHSNPRVVVADARTGASLWSPPPHLHIPQVESVAVTSHSGRTLIVSGALDRTLRVWDMQDGADPQIIQVDGDLSCLAITELDGNLVALCGGRNGEVRVADLLAPVPAQDMIPPVSAVAVSGETLLCGTERGIRVFGLASGTAFRAPETELRDVRAMATGSLGGRPVAVALERYGRPRGRAWYVDDGAPVPSEWMPEDAEAVALASHGSQTLAIFGTFGGTVIVADLATGEMTREPYSFGQRISHVGLTMVAGLPVLVVSCHGTVFARYLDDSDRERFPPWDETITPPIREDKALPNTSNGWATTIGDLGGTPFVACGNDDGKVALYAFPRERLAESPLTGSFERISTLAFRRQGDRPVLVSGAFDGTVRAWDLNDIRTDITISTLAEVRAIALAEPDLCVIGTTKGLLTVQLKFPDLAGAPEPVRVPHQAHG